MFPGWNYKNEWSFVYRFAALHGQLEIMKLAHEAGGKKHTNYLLY